MNRPQVANPDLNQGFHFQFLQCFRRFQESFVQFQLLQVSEGQLQGSFERCALSAIVRNERVKCNKMQMQTRFKVR